MSGRHSRAETCGYCGRPLDEHRWRFSVPGFRWMIGACPPAPADAAAVRDE